jgi:hypothetical protein
LLPFFASSLLPTCAGGRSGGCGRGGSRLILPAARTIRKGRKEGKKERKKMRKEDEKVRRRERRIYISICIYIHIHIYR